MARRGRMSAVKLAEAIGWSYSYLSRRLNGQKSWSVDDLEVIATYFDVPITNLFGRPDSSPMNGWTPDLTDHELVGAAA